MNDRLRIASEQLAALNNSAEWHPDAIVRGPFRWALMQADALIAAAAMEPSPVKTGCDDCRERAEAAEARAADLQAKLDEAARLAQDSAEAAGEMVGGAIQCPQCWGNCLKFTWHDWSRCACRGSGTITDRRKPTANDRALERILDAVDHARAIGMTLSPEFIEDIIREEAAHD